MPLVVMLSFSGCRYCQRWQTTARNTKRKNAEQADIRAFVGQANFSALPMQILNATYQYFLYVVFVFDLIR